MRKRTVAEVYAEAEKLSYDLTIREIKDATVTHDGKVIYAIGMALDGVHAVLFSYPSRMTVVNLTDEVNYSEKTSTFPTGRISSSDYRVT